VFNQFSQHLFTPIIMASEKSADIEIQVRESDDSIKETCDGQVDALTADWDDPQNKENPRNWSSRE
jgi:hypothetical protein